MKIPGLITTLPELEIYCRSITSNSGPLAVDVETNGIRIAWGHRICGIALSHHTSKDTIWSVYVPIRHSSLESGASFFEEAPVINLPTDKVFSLLKPILEDPKKICLAHSATFEKSCFLVEGIDIYPLHCTMVLSNLLHPERPNGLKKLMEIVLGEKHKGVNLLNEWFKFHNIKKNEDGFKFVPMETLVPYALLDSESCLKLYEQMKPEFPSIKKIYEIEWKLIPIIARMELRGIYCSSMRINKLLNECEKDLEVVRQHLFTLAGREFKPNSPEEVGTILYKELGAPYPTVNKGPTESDVLEKINHPFAKSMVAYRTLYKAIGTYLRPLKEQIQPDGKIYAKFRQVRSQHSDFGEDQDRKGTDSGRLAADSPNLHQMSKDKNYTLPNETIKVLPLRKVFAIPKPTRETWQYLLFDWSQIELRMLAELANEKTMLEAFYKGEDIHSTTAEKVFGKTWKDMNPADYHGDKELTDDQKRKLLWKTDYRFRAKCVHPDSIILLDGVPTRIGALKTGEEDSFTDLDRHHTVLDEKGTSKNLKQIYNGGRKELYHVITRRGVVTCSEEHRFAAPNGDLLSINKGTLNKGSFLAEPVLPKVRDLDTKDYPELPFKPYKRTPTSTIKTTPQLAYIAGMFLGDGAVSGHASTITHGHIDKTDTLGYPYKKWQATIVDILEEAGFSPTPNKEIVYLGSRQVTRYLEAIGLVKEEKPGLWRRTFRIPDWVFQAGPEAIKHFLGGLVDTDGCTTSVRATICTKYPTFAADIATAISVLNRTPCLDLSWNKKYKRWYYKISLTIEGSFELKPYMKHIAKANFLRQRIKSNHGLKPN